MYTSDGYDDGYGTDTKKKRAKKVKVKKPKDPAAMKKVIKCAVAVIAVGAIAVGGIKGSGYVMNKFGKSGGILSSTQTAKIPATAVSTSGGGSKGAVTTTDVSSVVGEVMPSIVAITNMSEVEYPTFFGEEQNFESESAGSGIIVKDDDKNLYIATNNHVVSGARTLTVQFVDDESVKATVQGTDESNDVAVVKIKKSDVKPDTLGKIKVATIGDSNSLAVGQAAIAIGNALGYGQSVTTGVISALNRQVATQGESSSDLIQTDAAINPGNSGGALMNTKGEVVGINSSKYSETSVEGMGFSIPMATAQPIIEDLIANGKVTSATKGGYLGIAGVDVTKEVASAYNIPTGIYITQTQEKSAAASAGMAQGDIITKLDDKKTTSMSALKQQISKHKEGDKVTITLQRRDKKGEYAEQKVEVTLGKYPEKDDSSKSDKKKDKGNEESKQQEGNDQMPMFPGEDGNGDQSQSKEQ